MTYQEKIKLFMEVKACRIAGLLPHIDIDYFTTSDNEAVGLWTDDDAEKVWDCLKANSKISASLTQPVCPFCIKSSKYYEWNISCVDCDVCGYHSNCVDYNSDFSVLCVLLKNRYGDISGLFTTEYYANLIKGINTVQQNEVVEWTKK